MNYTNPRSRNTAVLFWDTVVWTVWLYYVSTYLHISMSSGDNIFTVFTFDILQDAWVVPCCHNKQVTLFLALKLNKKCWWFSVHYAPDLLFHTASSAHFTDVRWSLWPKTNHTMRNHYSGTAATTRGTVHYRIIFNHRSRDRLLEFRTRFYKTISSEFLVQENFKHTQFSREHW